MSAPVSDASHDLDETVRGADPDRWLASRFIEDPTARADVLAIYAFNHELARAPALASEPLMAEIRLTWWVEALDDMFEGRPVRGHPAARALAEAVRRRGLDRTALAGMAHARVEDAHDGPFTDEGALNAYLDDTAGAVMRLAVQALTGEQQPGAVQAAGRAWGLAGLARMLARGFRTRLPDCATPERVEALVRHASAAARAAVSALPVKAFPAVAYACLAPVYGRGREPSDLQRRARLVWAAATGRI